MSVIKGMWKPGVEEGFLQVWFSGLLGAGGDLCVLPFQTCDLGRKSLCSHHEASRGLEEPIDCPWPQLIFCRLMFLQSLSFVFVEVVLGEAEPVLGQRSRLGVGQAAWQ